MELLAAIKPENKSEAVTAAEARRHKREDDPAFKQEHDNQLKRQHSTKEGEEA
jgi:hypothetical protein